MSEKFVILAESTCDLPNDYVKENNITIVKMGYSIGEELFESDNPLSPQEFYRRMREGQKTSTSMVNQHDATAAMEKFMAEGVSILYISFSSALSGSYNSAASAAKELSIKHNGKAKAYVIDSLCASMGQGLLVHYAVKFKDQGNDLEKTYNYVEGLKQNVCHYFTVNDLFHLHRGGRVTKSKAILGTLLKVKPLLYTSEEGKLTPLRNVKGRKKSIMALVESMEKKVGDFKNDIVFISHGDCMEDVDYLKTLIIQKFGITSFLASSIGPVVGAHSGPDTLALFFLGVDRKENVKI